MDFIPKHDSVHIPPDPPPDLGDRGFILEPVGLRFSGEGICGVGGLKNSEEDLKMKDVGMGWSDSARVSEISVGLDSGISRSIILSEDDLVCLGNVLGDNWKSRVLSEKLVFNNSDLKVSFSADSGLNGLRVGCSVNLIIEGLDRGDCYDEICSYQFGSVLEVLTKLAKCGGRMGGKDMFMKEVSGRVKFPQLDPNSNVFDLNSSGFLNFMDKRKKRSIRNEGLMVKASKVMWDDKLCMKVPLEGIVAGKDEGIRG
ncbi:hypothetical protein HanRHA438_Chr11g0507051 [Helianthus annuus]|nr:hypothetical protein HanHA300_Chr11g0405341 [Helianthus annuus]KAJ0509726.1 hypothetical protein HanIR_Chr11g0532431 [Helianthus annuus]KAJ0517732.1 hypothetical protein HanHA89_Chr11g0429071 [Helianthus annuus]KAJ0685748.1 hypothetical protein HanLR1_Chr11g0406561 [Helianthus annuus]KAJ0870989.1 hypothetical protein HanRHA438_Chr11g0507051 [Helianthus annuus]